MSPRTRNLFSTVRLKNLPNIFKIKKKNLSNIFNVLEEYSKVHLHCVNSRAAHVSHDLDP